MLGSVPEDATLAIRGGPAHGGGSPTYEFTIILAPLSKAGLFHSKKKNCYYPLCSKEREIRADYVFKVVH
ncbi:hypothetical protein NIES4071_80800 [Calothrix sp. NIES-4071]|nr:hypothetical protein NIES4071_80800 [Calothrix sp. NIES-4071]BAZ62350.1 hypothetical protein NIES4105_80730 [Calothrix sp. NIES-4105]